MKDKHFELTESEENNNKWKWELNYTNKKKSLSFQHRIQILIGNTLRITHPTEALNMKYRWKKKKEKDYL